MNLETSEISHLQKDKYDSTYVENSQIHKILSNSQEIEKWLTEDEERGNKGVVIHGYRICFAK